MIGALLRLALVGGAIAAVAAPTEFLEDFLPANWTSLAGCSQGVGECSNNGVWQVNGNNSGTWTGTAGAKVYLSNTAIVASDPVDPANDSNGYLALTLPPVFPYQSAEIVSAGKNDFSYGYYQVPIRLSALVGGTFSFFIQGNNTQLPEYDFEFSTDLANTVNLTTHPLNNTITYSLGFNPTTTSHKYGFLWTLDPGGATATVKEIIDGVTVRTESAASLLSNPAGNYVWMNAWVNGVAGQGGGHPSANSTSYYKNFRYWPGATSLPPDY